LKLVPSDASCRVSVRFTVDLVVTRD
jgi:hypothetical protein